MDLTLTFLCVTLLPLTDLVSALLGETAPLPAPYPYPCLGEACTATKPGDRPPSCFQQAA